MAIDLKIVLEPTEDGGFTAWVPSLPGCISEGATRDKALQNIREAIELYLQPVEDDAVLPAGAEVTNCDCDQASKRCLRKSRPSATARWVGCHSSAGQSHPPSEAPRKRDAEADAHQANYIGAHSQAGAHDAERFATLL